MLISADFAIEHFLEGVNPVGAESNERPHPYRGDEGSLRCRVRYDREHTDVRPCNVRSGVLRCSSCNLISKRVEDASDMVESAHPGSLLKPIFKRGNDESERGCFDGAMTVDVHGDDFAVTANEDAFGSELPHEGKAALRSE